MKSNFTQALRELTGFDGQTGSQETAAKNDCDNTVFSDTPVEEHINPESVTTVRDFSKTASDGSTYITSTMTVTGDIKSDDNIYVDGQMYGNVRTGAAVHSTALILGDINAQNAFFNGARVKGNICLTEDLVAGVNSAVIGDIKCNNADISGKIKGNCLLQGSARLSSSALLSGDITASDIATEQGAKIIGTISTGTDDINLDAEFDFGGEL